MFTEENFNPRTPCGVRLFHALQSLDDGFISIRAPLAGCDPIDERFREV